MPDSARWEATNRQEYSQTQILSWIRRLAQLRRKLINDTSKCHYERAHFAQLRKTKRECDSSAHLSSLIGFHFSGGRYRR